MTSKNSYWKLSKSNFKRRIPYFVLCFLFCFLLIPVVIYFEGESYVRNLDSYRYKYIVMNLLRDIAIEGYLQDAITIVLALAFAITGNAWNNSQRKNDFYKALPVKEKTRFVYIHVNSIISFIICFGCNLVLADVVVACLGFFDKAFIVATAYSLLIHTLEFIAVYMVAVIAQYLTGNVVLALGGASILCVVEPFVRALLDEFRLKCYRTYLNTSYDITRYLYDNVTSPVSGALTAHRSLTRFETEISLISSYKDVWSGVIKLLIQIIIYTAIAFYIYNKRQAQGGNKNIIFDKTKPFIKCLIMIPLVMGGVLLVMENVSDSMAPAFVGSLIVLGIMHIVLQYSIEGDFAAVKKGIISTAIAGVVVISTMLFFQVSGVRYDKYVPEKSEVESISIRIGDEYEYNFYNLDAYYNFMSSAQYFLNDVKLQDRTFVEKVVDIIDSDIKAGTYYYDENWVGDDACGQFDIAFNLKNGKKVMRNYLVPEEDYSKVIRMLYDLEEYRHAANQLEFANNIEMIEQAQRLEIVYYNYGISAFDMCAIEDKGLQQEMLEALRTDFNARNADMYEANYPIGYIDINARSSEYMVGTLTYQVYKDDVNTMAVLEKTNYKPQELDKSLINRIEVVKYDFSNGDIAVEDYTAPTNMTFTEDDECFDELLDGIVMSDAFWHSKLKSNGLRDKAYDAYAYTKDGNNSRIILTGSASKYLE